MVKKKKVVGTAKRGRRPAGLVAVFAGRDWDGNKLKTVREVTLGLALCNKVYRVAAEGGAELDFIIDGHLLRDAAAVLTKAQQEFGEDEWRLVSEVVDLFGQFKDVLVHEDKPRRKRK